MSFTTGFCSGGRLSAWRDTSVVAIPDLSLCWLVLKAGLSACSSSAVRTLHYTAGKPTRTGSVGGVVPQRYLFGNYEDERLSPIWAGLALQKPAGLLLRGGGVQFGVGNDPLEARIATNRFQVGV